MNLIAWQWSLYSDGHRNRANLLVHILTQPIFLIGTLMIPYGLTVAPWWYLVAGPLLMVAAIGIQGRTHRMEQTAPVPFRGPLDVVGRIFFEQWVNFPRYLLSGRFA